MTALAEGVIEASQTFEATMDAAEADARRIDGHIEAQERVLKSQIKAGTAEEALAFASALREKLMGASPALQKRIVRSVAARVVVSEDEIVSMAKSLISRRS